MRRFVATCLILAACAGGESAATSSMAETTSASTDWEVSQPFVGFSLSPVSFSEEGLPEFFDVAAGAGSLVAWVGPWQDIDEGGSLVMGAAGDHGFVPVVVTGFPTGDDMRILPDEPGEMIDTIANWVAEHPVPYLGFGVEINYFLWERSPDDFEWFVEIFPLVAEAVHDVSPETVVFPGFQLERLRGLKGGLFGDEPTDAEWELLERFPTADAIGFTTYPGLIFSDPADMPGDYYAEIIEHVDKPVVFTEVGWQAGGELGDWSGTPEKQADYVTDWVPELAEIGDMLIWSFLWDQEAAPPAFDTMGLISTDGDRRPALDAWTEEFR